MHLLAALGERTLPAALPKCPYKLISEVPTSEYHQATTDESDTSCLQNWARQTSMVLAIAPSHLQTRVFSWPGLLLSLRLVVQVDLGYALLAGCREEARRQFGGPSGGTRLRHSQHALLAS